MRPSAHRRLRAIDERHRIFGREAVESRHQEDVVCAVAERACRPDVVAFEEVGICDPAAHQRRLSEQVAVEHRELRVHARDRPVLAASTRDAQRNPLREHDVEHAVHQIAAGQCRRDGRTDLTHERVALDRVVAAGPDPDDVGGRNAPLGDVVVPHLPGRRVRLVDDDGDVRGGLRADAGRGTHQQQTTDDKIESLHAAGAPSPGADVLLPSRDHRTAGQGECRLGARRTSVAPGRAIGWRARALVAFLTRGLARPTGSSTAAAPNDPENSGRNFAAARDFPEMEPGVGKELTNLYLRPLSCSLAGHFIANWRRVRTHAFAFFVVIQRNEWRSTPGLPRGMPPRTHRRSGEKSLPMIELGGHKPDRVHAAISAKRSSPSSPAGGQHRC